MKKLLLSLAVVFYITTLSAQTIVCNPSGNLMIYSCYDGGYLSINVDANIPNLKIGIVSYESMSVYLSGTYVNNVTEVSYAGYNGVNNPCGITTTTIGGAPAGVNPYITSYPPSPLANPNGNALIVCGTSCSTTTNQGGCNTIDQIEAYFLNIFPGSVLYAHAVQYGCWTGTQNVSAGGTCCTSSVGVSEHLTNNTFSVYPNPASDFINVKTNKSLLGSVYSIVDQLGRTILKGKLTDETTTIKINELSEGVYLLKTGEQMKQTFKVLKR